MRPEILLLESRRQYYYTKELSKYEQDFPLWPYLVTQSHRKSS